MDCIVLAGGVPEPGESLFRVTQGCPKAMLPVFDRPMVEHVIRALRDASSIDRIVLVGLDQEQDLDVGECVHRVAPQGSIIANLYAGIQAVTVEGPVAYCGSDIPLLTDRMVDRFVSSQVAQDADVSAGLVTMESLVEKYPGTEDLWLRLAEGDFIAADFAVFKPRRAATVRKHLERLAPLRKSAFRQAWAVGPALLLRYLTGRLSIPLLQEALYGRYGISCRIGIVEDPEMGLDVDRIEDLRLCQQILTARAGADVAG